MDAGLAAARGRRPGRADRRADDPRLPPGARRAAHTRCSSPTRPTAPTRPPPRSPASRWCELKSEAERRRRPRRDLARHLDERRGRVHDHQPQHARALRAAASTRSPSCATPRACWSTWTAPTSTPSSASRAPATSASTSATSTCTRPSPRRTAAAAPARARSASRRTSRRSCRRRSWSKDGDELRARLEPAAVDRQAPGLLRQLRHARARLHLHPHAWAPTGCARSPRTRCSTPTTS